MDHRIVRNFSIRKKAAAVFQGKQTRQKQLKQNNRPKTKILK